MKSTAHDRPQRRGYKCRPRRVRVPLGRAVLPTDIDSRMADELLRFGAADTKTLLVLRYTWKLGERVSMASDARRLTTLMHGGWLARVDPKFGMLRGSHSFIYTIETGRGMASLATRRHYQDLSKVERERIAEEATPLRERLCAFFAERGFDRGFVEQRLENHTRMLQKFYSGDSSHMRHKALCSAFCAILFLGLRAQGVEIEKQFADGEIAFPLPGGDGKDTIEPDFVFTTPHYGFAVEAETGTQSRASVKAKLQSYLRLFRDVKLTGIAAALNVACLQAFTVFFYCKRVEHARLVSEELHALPDAIRKHVLVVCAEDLSIERTQSGEPLTIDHYLGNLVLATGQTTYAYLASRIFAEIFTYADVTGCWLRPLFDPSTDCLRISTRS